MAVDVVPTPGMLNVASTATDGPYSLYFNDPGTHSLELVRGGSLPPVSLDLNGSLVGADFILPPEDDWVSNGGLDGGLNAWHLDSSSSNVSAVASSGIVAEGHSGQVSFVLIVLHVFRRQWLFPVVWNYPRCL